MRRSLAETYGPNVADRVRLLRATAVKSGGRFGDRPIRLFRAPGRINLRGMHVDSHGGFLNLMTHQREIVVAVAPAVDKTVTFANVDAGFPDVSFRLGGPFGGSWQDFIMRPDTRAEAGRERGWWGHYVKGCFLSVQHRFPGTPLLGMAGVVGSDVPRGAALSSSAALCVSVCRAILACNGLALDDGPLILAARDAEWYTGSRCGVSDQVAIVLGGRNALVNVALLASELDTSGARVIRFPEALRILVINSYTERSLSGRALVEYTKNRFAYSLAMEILRQEMHAQHVPDAIVERMDRLSNITPDVLEPIGGMAAIPQLLRSIPESLELATMRQRYDLPNFDEAYMQYFGSAPEAERPKRIGLRGPLLFGIAESERARVFADALEAGGFERAGKLMTAGHDGDRKVRADGTPYAYDVSDGVLERVAAMELCPGAYGASSPVLDSLVDRALGAGALGACLTGAGIAGAVLALCHAGDAGRIAEALRAHAASDEYAALARPLTEEEIAGAVVVNDAPARAGELRIA